jgi:tRNA (uracil-5-)-methyltransferase TRM9
VLTDTVDLLLTLNRQFYQTFAGNFSATRQRLQPGVRRIISSLPAEADILDLGCGNGEVWRTLAQRNHLGRYTGLDFSAGLLEIARRSQAASANAPQACFIQAELSSSDWRLQAPQLPYSVCLAFAFLHHLPGQALRLSVLQQARSLLSPGGRLIHSEWQFLNSERLRQRIQPWTRIGLQAEQVDPGDYLLDWRHGGEGLRYVHHFTPEELAGLAQAAGFRVLETFFSDGEGGRLGLYQVLELQQK